MGESNSEGSRGTCAEPAETSDLRARGDARPERLAWLRQQILIMLRARRVSSSEAEDLAHTVLVRVMNRWEELQDSFDDDLLMHARWTTLSVQEHARRQRWRREPLEDDESIVDNLALQVDDFLASMELWALRVAVIPELPVDLAAVLTARLVRGLSVKTVALELGIPAGTVKTRSRMAGEAWSALCRKRGL